MKHWRSIRRFSQLSLSTETGISSRHISFLETGRARPSRNSVLTLARALEMPKPAVNDALLAAGLAPEFPAMDIMDADIQPMMEAIMTIMNNHLPMPAIVIDGNWQIVGGNTAAMHLMQFLPLGGSLCIVDALLNDDPGNPVFLNWETLATWTLSRLQLEAARSGKDGELFNIYQRLANAPRLANFKPSSISDNKPYLTMNARIEGQDLSLFTMLAVFTTAQDIVMSERRVELFFAADEATRLYFENLAKND